MILFLFLFIKGEWVIRWEIPDEKSAIKIIQEAKEEGYNTIFVQTYARGEVLYPSLKFPRFEELRTKKDILKIIIKNAHKSGISVHIWINLFYVWSQAPFPKKYNHLRYIHPEWFLVDRQGKSMVYYSIPELKKKNLPGYFISPFSNGVLNYFKELIEEIINNYNIDGVHFDYVRFPSSGLDYGKDIETAFMRKYYLNRNDQLTAFIGKVKISNLWKKEKAERITKIIQELSQEIRSINPHIIISSACISDIETAKRDFAQDWILWVKKGIIDYAVPMLYSSDENYFKNKLKKYLYLKSYIFPGIGGFLFEDKYELEKQENIAKGMGFSGYIIFSSGSRP